VFIIIWRYSVAPDREGDFLSGYGPNGEWSRLFSRADGYLGTELVECDQPGFYVTVDRWQNEADFDGFTAAANKEYEEPDLRLAALTTSEELIGRGSAVG
jgi:heme-degrading monooxygenase HmoA